MDYQKLFEQFDKAGKLVLPGTEISFADISWSKHPTFEGAEIKYEPGVISILPVNIPHEVTAGSEGLYIFAKFMPALN